jgi:serine/threonine-protein kinase HipA
MLDVYLFGARVGMLEEREGSVSFRYSEAALCEPLRSRLSLSLPVREEPFGPVALAWFENLLPEGEARNALAAAVKRDPSDVVGLLAEAGGECAGAVSLWPAGQTPPAPTYEPVTAEDVSLELGGEGGAGRAKARVSARQSVGGAADKLVLLRRGAALFLPGPGSPGNVVVKTGEGRGDGLIANELGCLRLLAAAGATVARASLLRAGDEIFLDSRRYDRLQRSDGSLRRLHQEDLCQATGRPSRCRYQIRGGPDYAEIRTVLQRHGLRPLADLESLIRWAFLNVLVGNQDGHAGNLSLLYLDEGIRLAPFYDVMSTDVYEGRDRTFAIHVGGCERPEALDAEALRGLAGDLSTSPRRLRAVAEETADSVEAALPSVLEGVAGEAGHEPVLDRLGQLVRKRLKLLRGVLTHI